MKEAAGEANMTVITIVLIAIVAAVATPLVTNMVNNSADKACCNSLGGYVDGANCKIQSQSGSTSETLKGLRKKCDTENQTK